MLPSHEQPFAPRNDDQTAVAQPIETEWKRKRHSNGDFTHTIDVDGDDFLSAPVRKPQTALMPAWRLAHRDTSHQRLHFCRQVSFACIAISLVKTIPI